VLDGRRDRRAVLGDEVTEKCSGRNPKIISPSLRVSEPATGSGSGRRWVAKAMLVPSVCTRRKFIAGLPMNDATK
jgi:hypothetical protein